MANRRIWAYNPHSGGTTIPDHVRQSTERRIEAFAAEHFAGRYRKLTVRFRGQFCYVDAFVEPGPCPQTGPRSATRRPRNTRPA